jgi:acyl-coenzyme A synthetase/AMP-(fatty) acid ligase
VAAWPTSDGWFHTGDAAAVHPDSYVEIRDRIKDVIISGWKIQKFVLRGGAANLSRQ